MDRRALRYWTRHLVTFCVAAIVGALIAALAIWVVWKITVAMAILLGSGLILFGLGCVALELREIANWTRCLSVNVHTVAQKIEKGDAQ